MGDVHPEVELAIERAIKRASVGQPANRLQIHQVPLTRANVGRFVRFLRYNPRAAAVSRLNLLDCVIVQDANDCGVEDLCAFLKTTTNLSNIELLFLGPVLLGQLLLALRNNHSVTNLKVVLDSEEGMDITAASKLAVVLQQSPHLEELSVWSPLSFEAAVALRPGLAAIPSSLQELKIHAQGLDDRAACELLEGLIEHAGLNNLKSLVLEETAITSNSLDLVVALVGKTELTRLSFLSVEHGSSSLFSDSHDMTLFLNALSHKTSLRELDLYNCNLNHETTVRLFQYLEDDTTLETLDVSNWPYSRRELARNTQLKVMESIRKMKGLRKLIIDVKESWAADFGSALQENTSLHEVVQSFGKPIPGAGIDFLMKRNRLLTEVAPLLRAPPESIPLGQCFEVLSKLNRLGDAAGEVVAHELLSHMIVRLLQEG